jgi:uncharacterized YigZ family protein
MNQPKNFQTIKKINESRLKEKSSIFIGRVLPICNFNEIDEILAQIKKEFYDASHHCYAYKLIDGSLKFSDSGEPTGTAGIRILNAIEHFNLNNILVVVIRYFGGTKLGVGPLGKAYYICAFNTLETAEKINKQGAKKIALSLNFEQINILYKVLNQYDGKIVSEEYGDLVLVECLIPIDKTKDFIIKIADDSNGKIKSKVKKSIIYI